MFAYNLTSGGVPNNSFLLSEPDDISVDGSLVLCIAPLKDVSSSLRLGSIVVQSKADTTPAFGRQFSAPLKLSQPLAPVGRQVSFNEDFNVSLSSSPVSLVARSIPIERVRIRTTDAGKGWVIQVPQASVMSPVLADYRTKSVLSDAPHCVVTFYIDDDSSQDANLGTVSVEFPLTDIPLADSPGRCRQVFMCDNLETSIPSLLSTIWTVYGGDLRNQPNDSTEVQSMWKLVWTVGVFLESIQQRNGVLNSRMLVITSLNAVCSVATSFIEESSQSDLVQARVVIACVSSCAHIMQYLKPNMKEDIQPSKLLEGLSCLPLDQKVLLRTKSLVSDKLKDQLEGNHLSRLFREGLIGILELDAQTFPIASFDSVRCGVYLEVAFGHVSERNVAALKRASPEKSETVLRHHLNAIEASMNKIMEQMQKAFYNPEDVGAMLNVINQDLGLLDERVARCKIVTAFLHVQDDALNSLNIDQGPLSRARAQLTDVVHHLRRKREEVVAFFRDTFQRTIVATPQALENLEPKAMAPPFLSKLRPTHVQGTLGEGASQHPEQQRLREFTNRQVAVIRTSSSRRDMLLVRVIHAGRLAVFSPRLRVMRICPLQSIMHAYIQSHPAMEICCLSNSVVDDRDLLLCVKFSNTTLVKKNESSLVTTLLVFKLRIFDFDDSFVVREMRTVVRSSRTVTDASCIGDFREGTIAVASKVTAQLFLLKTKSAATSGETGTTSHLEYVETIREADRAMDGPISVAALDAPIMCMAHYVDSENGEGDCIIFASAKKDSTMTIREVSASGGLRTLAKTTASTFKRMRLTAIVPRMEEIEGQQVLFAYSVEDDQDSMHKYQFVKTGEGAFSLMERTIVNNSMYGVKEGALAGVDEGGVFPSHISFVPDRETLAYGCGYLTPGLFGAVSTKTVELRAKAKWEQEVVAWDMASQEFIQCARTICKDMSSAHSFIHRVETTLVAHRLHEETSKAYWTALARFNPNVLTSFFPVFLYAAPSLSDVSRLLRNLLQDLNKTGIALKQRPELSQALSTWVDLYPWPEVAMEQDLASLTEMVQAGDGILSDYTLARVFASKNFYCPFEDGLRLLMASLVSTQWDARDLFRLPTIHWLNRIDPDSAAPRPLPAFTALKRTMTYWEERFERYNKLLSTSQAARLQGDIRPAMEWLCVAHLRTVSARKITAVRALVHLDATASDKSPVKQLLLNNLPTIIGTADMYQNMSSSSNSSTTFNLIQAATLDRIGVLRCTVWNREPSLEFFSKGTLPSNLQPLESDFLAEPVGQFRWLHKEETNESAGGGSSSSSSSSSAFILDAKGCFEAVASGTFVFAWVQQAGSQSQQQQQQKGGTQSAMWIGVSSMTASMVPGDAFAGMTFKYVKGNQPVLFELPEGEHLIAIKAFSKVADVRLAVEGPFTQAAAKQRIETPHIAKKLPYPTAASLFCIRNVREVDLNGDAAVSVVSAQFAWTLLRSSLRARLEAEKTASSAADSTGTNAAHVGGTKRKFADMHTIDAMEKAQPDSISKLTSYPSLLSAERRLYSPSKVINELLDFGLDACHLLLGCFGSERKSVTLQSASIAKEDEFHSFLERIKAQLHIASQSLRNGDLSTSQLDRLAPYKSALSQALHLLGIRIVDETDCSQDGAVEQRVDQLQKESLDCFKSLERLLDVLSSFAENVEPFEANAPKEEQDELFTSRVEAMLRGFKKTPLSEVKRFLHSLLAEPFRPKSKAFEFLAGVHLSFFFKRLWDSLDSETSAAAGEGSRRPLSNKHDEEGEIGFELGVKVQRIYDTWKKQREALLEDKLTWNVLENVLNVHEFEGENMDREQEMFFQLGEEDDADKKQVALVSLKQWRVLCLTSHGWEMALRCLPLLEPLLVVEAAAPERARVETILRESGRILGDMEKESRLQGLTIRDTNELVKALGIMDVLHPPILLRMDESFCEALAQALPLLQWLRKTPNDVEFASSIEMAFTKPELQVPQELWNHEKGCVREEILGFLTDVRTNLHQFVFDSEQLPFESLRSLVSSLQSCVEKQTRHAGTLNELTQRLRTLNGLRRQLMQLLAGDEPSSQDSHNQLLFLQSCSAEWICSSCEDLSMQYLVASSSSSESTAPVAAAKMTMKKLDRETLADLQSTLVLGQVQSDEDEIVADLANAFVEELSMFDMIVDYAQRLKKTGHLCFQEFELRCVFGKNTLQLREALEELDALVVHWDNSFKTFRDSFPALSCFTNRQVVEFVALLLHVNQIELPKPETLIRFPTSPSVHLAKLKNTSKQTELDVETIALRLLVCRDPDLLDAANVYKRLWTECQQMFRIIFNDRLQAAAATEANPVEALNACGEALNGAISSLAPQVTRRRVRLSNSSGSAAQLGLFGQSSSSSGLVKVIRVSSPSKMIDISLTAYAIMGRMPSRQDCVYCGPFVTADSVLNLVRRWEQESDPTALFCLIGPHALTFDHQRQVGKTLERIAADANRNNPGTTKRCPFLIVVCPSRPDSADESAIEVMFASTGRIALAPLPVRTLRQFLQDGLKARGVKAICFSSTLPGQGKTFQIRRFAAAESSTSDGMHVFRINAVLSLDFLIGLARIPDGCSVVHVDISDSATRSTSALSSLLFDYILLNGFLDETTGNSCVWTSSPKHPKTLLVEIPSKAPLRETRLCQLLEQRVVTSSEDSFLADFESLKTGIGHEDFFSSRFDGTVPSRLVGTSNECGIMNV